MTRESYCSMCDDCPLGTRDFLETVEHLKEYVEQIRKNYWSHCFPDETGFDIEEFRKGLNWFLANTECPGCKAGRGLPDCPIRLCAQQRQLENCYRCPELEMCDKFDFLLQQFPDLKNNLRRRQIKFKAWIYHQHRKVEGK